MTMIVVERVLGSNSSMLTALVASAQVAIAKAALECDGDYLQVTKLPWFRPIHRKKYCQQVSNQLQEKQILNLLG
jgi:hypothetical protein